MSHDVLGDNREWRIFDFADEGGMGIRWRDVRPPPPFTLPVNCKAPSAAHQCQQIKRSWREATSDMIWTILFQQRKQAPTHARHRPTYRTPATAAESEMVTWERARWRPARPRAITTEILLQKEIDDMAALVSYHERHLRVLNSVTAYGLYGTTT
ncbi:hypothetical protein BDZ91DRAFT_758714 [Kalaharituber pfeilii]|nr:hypothetical protein BDZ91DRAFT_758714 [Kalaharituber pfeilii]